MPFKEKPKSLTEDRCFDLMPRLRTCEEWLRKKEAGELSDGLLGMRGMLKTVYPDEKFTQEEAEYILWLRDQCSMRCLAEELVGDDNQVFGMMLIEAAELVLAETGG